MTRDLKHPTQARIHLDRLRHNLSVLQSAVGDRPMWPAIKANAYGHGAELVARELVAGGYKRLCVAHVNEAVALLDAGVEAEFIVLSAILPPQAKVAVAYALEPSICTTEVAQALSQAATAAGRDVAVHIKVDTGMGRIGVGVDAAADFLAFCRGLAGVRVLGLMSHFASADEADKTSAERQLRLFRDVADLARTHGIDYVHMANSAGVLDLPTSHFDVVRPGIAVYGLAPSDEIASSLAASLQPVLEWVTRISFLKEVSAGVGLSYGHAFTTTRDSLIATIPVGYGDGLARSLSGRFDVLVSGQRCPQVGRITMDQSLIDVTALRGRTALGDPVTLIGRQGGETIGAGELADRLGTISYEVVTAIAPRVPRIAVDSAREIAP